MVLIVIENLEPFSPWLLYEYEHAYELVGEALLVTNVKEEKLKEELEKRGIRFREESVVEILQELPKPWVVLEPKAEEELSPEEATGTVIVGGILGSHPPKGRTWQLLTSRLPDEVLKRNIGPHQFSIDGAVAMAWLISKGKRLKEIPIKVGLEIKVGEMPGMEIYDELPYAYPIIDGRVFFSEKVKEYLEKNLLGDRLSDL